MASLTILAVLATGCTDDATTPGARAGSAVEVKEIPLFYFADIDILFVVDNSPSMAPYLAHLDAAARPLVESIESVRYRPNVHIGVVTGDPSDRGRLRGGRFLSDATEWNWRAQRNYEGTLPDSFASLFDVGASGATSQALVSNAMAALSPATNPGFIRDDAYLAVVILTATDDPDAGVTATASVLKGLKDDPAKVIVAAATLDSAPNLAALLEQFPSRNTHVALDAPDLTPLVALTQQLLKFTLGAACVEGAVVEPRQASASLRNPDTSEEVGFAMCGGTTTERCWSFVEDPIVCANSADHLRIDLPYTPFPATAVFNIATEIENR
ncbi:MAG TPA: vWA domain-containing protein [Kofleriaceae bacterium]|jgi:hypothetical protein